MRQGPLGGLTIKAALIIGFGLTLGLWLLTGYRLAEDIAEVEEQSAGMASRYVQAQETLSTLRSHVLSTSGTVRDALLDRVHESLDAYHEQLESRLSAVLSTVKGYRALVDTPEERLRIDQLGVEADLFAAGLRAVRLPQGSQAPSGRTIFNNDVLPRRTTFLRVTEDLQAFNRAAFIQHSTTLATRHNAAERAIWERLGWALLLSLGIAVIATVYSGWLEKRLRSQLVADAIKTRALQDLSIKIIRAQEDERRRIAHELHDEIGQALTALKVEISLARRAMHGRDAPPDLLHAAESITDRALHAVRDLSHLLHPAVLDDLGLPDAVASYLREFSTRFGITTDLHVHGMAVRLSPDIEVAAYRMIQEALTNVAKHARATRCEVTLNRLVDTFEIRVADNGAGFDLANLASGGGHKGLGLIGMRERALQLAGVVSVESTPGHGTILRILLSTHPPADPGRPMFSPLASAEPRLT